MLRRCNMVLPAKYRVYACRSCAMIVGWEWGPTGRRRSSPAGAALFTSFKTTIWPCRNCFRFIVAVRPVQRSRTALLRREPGRPGRRERRDVLSAGTGGRIARAGRLASVCQPLDRQQLASGFLARCLCASQRFRPDRTDTFRRPCNTAMDDRRRHHRVSRSSLVAPAMAGFSHRKDAKFIRNGRDDDVFGEERFAPCDSLKNAHRRAAFEASIGA